MAFVAASTNAGTRKKVNEDACCIEVAQTPLGEVLMAIVCDGVGGLSRGNVASSTVIDRFVRWFEGELPMLMGGMVEAGAFDFALVKAVWGTMLQSQNDLIRTHGIKAGGRLGTTFTGIIACGGHYLAGHVGDCRAYRMNPIAFEQITEDQSLVAKQLAAGEITEEEARKRPKNVILQSVGTERVVKPVFYEGSVHADDLFVICCDGAYHRVENGGIRHLFQRLDYRDEAAMGAACDTLLRTDMDYGEKDNLTVLCFSGDLAAAGLEGYDGSLDAVTSVVSDVFLYPLLRDKYGAYGVMHGALEDAQAMYVITYRDPNIAESFDVFDQLPEMVATMELDQDTLDGYILSAYSSYALSQGELSGALSAALSALSDEDPNSALTYMRQLKALKAEDLESYAEIYQNLMSGGMRFTSGSAEQINQNAERYETILNPFNAQDHSKVTFMDLTEDHEYYVAARTLYEDGLMLPLSEDVFGVDEMATQEDLFYLVSMIIPEGSQEPVVPFSQYNGVAEVMMGDGPVWLAGGDYTGDLSAYEESEAAAYESAEAVRATAPEENHP